MFIILGIAGAIISFYYSDNVTAAAEREYRDGWRRAIEQYTMDSEAMRSVDAFQRAVSHMFPLFNYDYFMLIRFIRQNVVVSTMLLIG